MSASDELLKRGEDLSFHEAMDLLIQQCEETLHELPYTRWKQDTIDLARECLDWIEAVLKANDFYLDGVLQAQKEYHIGIALRLQECPRLKAIGYALAHDDYRDLAF